MDTIKKYWQQAMWIATVIIFVVGWLDMKSDASDAKSIMQKQTEINENLKKTIEAAQTKLEVYLEVYGFDDELAREWNAMPRELPTDTGGVPITWQPWLEVSDDYKTGIRFMVDDSARVLVDTLWHIKGKK